MFHKSSIALILGMFITSLDANAQAPEARIQELEAKLAQAQNERDILRVKVENLLNENALLKRQIADGPPAATKPADGPAADGIKGKPLPSPLKVVFVEREHIDTESLRDQISQQKEKVIALGTELAKASQEAGLNVSPPASKDAAKNPAKSGGKPNPQLVAKVASLKTSAQQEAAKLNILLQKESETFMGLYVTCETESLGKITLVANGEVKNAANAMVHGNSYTIESTRTPAGTLMLRKVTPAK